MIDDNVNAKAGDVNFNIRKLAIECASKRNYPDILNMPMLRKTGSNCAPMGCRSFLSEWIDPTTGAPKWDGRNNLGVVSVNLPRIALQSKNKEKFFEILDKRLELAYDALESRVDRFKNVKAKVAPILYCSGAFARLDPEDYIFEIFKEGRATISLGYIGINETINALFDDDTPIVKSKEKQEFALKIVEYLKDRTELWKKKTGLGYGLYSTPSESLCDRFHRLDKQMFGVIDGVTDKEYYTNSFHLDVREKVSPMVKIDFEAPYHKLATGGHITFVEVPNVELSYRQIIIDECWKYVYDKLPYFGTNCSIDKCHKCGWTGDSLATDEGYSCPHCGNSDLKTLEVTKRVCGYLGNANSRPFNHGKQREVTLRTKHK